jgi:hypothetical protein
LTAGRDRLAEDREMLIGKYAAAVQREALSLARKNIRINIRTGVRIVGINADSA